MSCRAKEAKKMEKILVAYDATESADAALRTASELAEAFDAHVGVVSVVPVHLGRSPVDPWDGPDVHAAALERARGILRDHGIQARVHEAYGDPSRSIEELAEEEGYDTIVVGSRGLGPLERVFQGSVSEHVATHTNRTVVIAHK
jgi:nucleotide-binding universal stress UspA family protein